MCLHGSCARGPPGELPDVHSGEPAQPHPPCHMSNLQPPVPPHASICSVVHALVEVIGNSYYPTYHPLSPIIIVNLSFSREYLCRRHPSRNSSTSSAHRSSCLGHHVQTYEQWPVVEKGLVEGYRRDDGDEDGANWVTRHDTLN